MSPGRRGRRPPRGRPRRAVAAVVVAGLVALTAACAPPGEGVTIPPVDGLPVAGGLPVGGSPAAAPSAGASAASAGPAHAGALPASSTAAGGPSTSPGAAVAGGPPGSAEQPPRPGGGPAAGGEPAGPAGGPPGADAPAEGAASASGEEILVGVQVTTDLQAAFGAVGAAGRPPDERLVVQALLDHVNATGGAGGRPLRAVFHETNPTSGTFAAQAQAACATFTEDTRVAAVASSPVGGDDALLACLAPTGTPLVEQNHWWFDGPTRDAHRGLLVQPGKVRPEIGIGAMVDGLHRAGFFDGATIGVIRFDAPVFARMTDQVLVPELARRGLQIASGADVVVGTPAGVSDFGSMNAEIGNAIVRFRAAGVTHVLVIENAAVLSFFFTQQAEAAGFRPLYGLSTYNTPSTLANQAPAEQLRGAVGVGWSPPNDVFDAQHPGGNPTWQTCTDVFAAAGLLSDYAAQGYYLQAHCDSILLLREVLARTGGAGGPAAFAAAVDGLGETHTSPMGFRTRLGPGRHDGAAARRLFAFDDACACFAYTGPVEDL